MNVPKGIDRLSARDAWLDGHRAGREELAAELMRDKVAREEADGRTLGRIDAAGQALRSIQNDARDSARQQANIVRRLERVEAIVAEATGRTP